MKEISHAELEAPHYTAVRNNINYRLEGMFDVLQDELMMSSPNFPDTPEVTNVPEKVTPYLLQRLNELEGKLHKHIDKKKYTTYEDEPSIKK